MRVVPGTWHAYCLCVNKVQKKELFVMLNYGLGMLSAVAVIVLINVLYI